MNTNEYVDISDYGYTRSLIERVIGKRNSRITPEDLKKVQDYLVNRIKANKKRGIK